jgi:hypothetical protein
LGLGRPLSSHSRSGADRTAQPFLSQPEGGSGGSGATCRHPGTYGLQTQGSYRSFNKSVASDFLDEAVRCCSDKPSGSPSDPGTVTVRW